MKFVDPKTDIAFKKIFSNDAHKSILIEFLNEILVLEYPIATLEILNPYQLPKLYDLKNTSLDIRAKDTANREFIVEMQVEKETAFVKRAVYYSSKAYSQQLQKTEKYHLLKPVIFLGILDFTIFDHASVLSRHLILNAETGQHDLKDLEFNFIELPKFTKLETELETTADKWIYFIQQADNLDHVPSSADTPALQEAYDIAAQHHWTQEELDIYESQGFAIGKARNSFETARLDGEAIGEKRGELQAKLQIAKNLLIAMNDTQIADMTGLTIEAVAELRNGV